jgi:hypothetical protein
MLGECILALLLLRATGAFHCCTFALILSKKKMGRPINLATKDLTLIILP